MSIVTTFCCEMLWFPLSIIGNCIRIYIKAPLLLSDCLIFGTLLYYEF